MTTGSSKNSFDFRMSKKVAELTQVVHMLFTRNHEKEVEAEALKDAYEYEIEQVIHDAKDRIAKLEKKIEALQSANANDENQFKLKLDEMMAQQQAEWTSKLQAMDTQLQAEKQECQNARDLLIQAHMDIEKLREAQSGEAGKAQQDLDLAAKEIQRLRAQVLVMENSLMGKDVELGQVAVLQRANDNLQREIETTRGEMESMEKMKEQLISRNKQLETDIRNLRRELSKRAASSAKVAKTPPPPPATTDYDGEVERLRAQIQMYRNELSNREQNFNRMFTDKQPIQVGGRQGPKLTFTQTSSEGMNALRFSREYTQMLPNRQKTLVSQHRGRLDSTEEDGSTTPRSGGTNSSIGERLPQLGMDQRARLQRLAKPKPLSRDLLSAKAKT